MQLGTEIDFSQMPSAWDYPHFLSSCVVAVAVTASVGIWSGLKRGETTRVGPLGGLILFLIWNVVHVTFSYLLPAFVAVAVLKVWVLRIHVPYAAYTSELMAPAAQMAVLFCLLANYADAWSVGKRVSLRRHCVQFLIALLPGYYAFMAAAWLLARLMAASGTFNPAYVKAANGLFSVPRLHTDSVLNAAILVVAVLLPVVISYGLRLHRALTEE